jgi:hypothetical protein
MDASVFRSSSKVTYETFIQASNQYGEGSMVALKSSDTASK